MRLSGKWWEWDARLNHVDKFLGDPTQCMVREFCKDSFVPSSQPDRLLFQEKTRAWREREMEPRRAKPIDLMPSRRNSGRDGERERESESRDWVLLLTPKAHDSTRSIILWAQHYCIILFWSHSSAELDCTCIATSVQKSTNWRHEPLPFPQLTCSLLHINTPLYNFI